MTQRRGLGRGLGAIIPAAGVRSSAVAGRLPTIIDLRDTPAEDGSPMPSNQPVTRSGDVSPIPEPEPEGATTADLQYAELPVTRISANPVQPRQVFDEESLAELAHSIREIGLLQPIVVRPSGDGFELVAGERRLRASRLAGLERIPALIRRTADDAMLREALLENLHRVQLNPLEEAAAYSQLLADFDCTQEELATRIGRSRPQVANTLRLLKLPTAVQRRVAAGVISAGHARALLGVGDPQRIEALAGRVVAEGLSVRTVEELVSTETAARRAPRRGRSPVVAPIEYRATADRLSDYLDTRVRVEVGRRAGRLIVDFADVEDLARIVEVIQSPARAQGSARSSAGSPRATDASAN